MAEVENHCELLEGGHKSPIRGVMQQRCLKMMMPWSQPHLVCTMFHWSDLGRDCWMDQEGRWSKMFTPPSWAPVNKTREGRTRLPQHGYHLLLRVSLSTFTVTTDAMILSLTSHSRQESYLCWGGLPLCLPSTSPQTVMTRSCFSYSLIQLEGLLLMASKSGTWNEN